VDELLFEELGLDHVVDVPLLERELGLLYAGLELGAAFVAGVREVPLAGRLYVPDVLSELGLLILLELGLVFVEGVAGFTEEFVRLSFILVRVLLGLTVGVVLPGLVVGRVEDDELPDPEGLYDAERLS